MRIVLVRHGDAGAYTLPDSARNLSALGQKQAAQTALWLKNQGHLQNACFVCSPYNRAQQTLQAILRLAPRADYTVCDRLTPNDDPKAALAALDALSADAQDDGVLVAVCHMNVIAKTAALLSGELARGFSLAEARVFAAPCFLPDQGVLIDAFVPEDA